MGRKKAIKGSLSWLRAVVHYLIMKPFARDVCRSPRLWTQNSHLMIITGENGGLGFMYDVYIMKGSLKQIRNSTLNQCFFFFFFWNRLIITVLFSIRLIKKSRQQSLIDGEGTQNDNHRKKFLLSIVVFNWRNERNE